MAFKELYKCTLCTSLSLSSSHRGFIVAHVKCRAEMANKCRERERQNTLVNGKKQLIEKWRIESNTIYLRFACEEEWEWELAGIE